MALHSGMGPSEPLRPEPIGARVGPRDPRRTTRGRELAVGTLACPSCDAPAPPPAAPLSPADPMACGFCGHAEAVRDFLSLAEPTRPTRVSVRVVLPAPAGV